MPTNAQLLKIIDVLGEVAELGLDLPGVMNLVTEKVLDLVQADGAVVELAEEDSMVYRAVAGAASSQLGVRVRIVGSLSGECMRQRKPLVCVDSEQDPRVDRDACRRVGLRSMVVVPLMHEGAAVGVLKAFSGELQRFGEPEVLLLSLLSRVVGTSMYWSTRYGSDDLFYRATHDDLTGLANRALFMDRLRHAIHQAQRQGARTAIVVIDMDGLKVINDNLGHAVGDEAIVEFSRRVRETARSSDTVARLGGDEFAVILGPVQSVDDAQGLKQRLVQAMHEPLQSQGRAVQIDGSFGCALFPDDAPDLLGLLVCADKRMYDAKRDKKQQGGRRAGRRPAAKP